MMCIESTVLSVNSCCLLSLTLLLTTWTFSYFEMHCVHEKPRTWGTTIARHRYMYFLTLQTIQCRQASFELYMKAWFVKKLDGKTLSFMCAIHHHLFAFLLNFSSWDPDKDIISPTESWYMSWLRLIFRKLTIHSENTRLTCNIHVAAAQ